MGMRKHLTYANVTSTLALVIALGTGSAYAVDQIGSGDIRNNSVASEDLRDKQGVKGIDVEGDSLGRREIDERSLVASRMLDVAGDQANECDLVSTGFSDCVRVSVRLARRGRVLVVATGAFYSEAATTSNARCEIRLDDIPAPIGQTPGELADNTDATATDGFAVTSVQGPTGPGLHDVALACQQLGPEAAVVDAPTLMAVALTGR